MKNYIYQFGLMFLVLLASCAELDEPQPRNSIATEFAINNFASASAAMNGVYSDLQDATLVFDGFLALPQLFSDETVFTGTFPTRLEFGNLNVFPANGTMAAVFSDMYEVINRANNVIALVPGVEDVSMTDAVKNNFVAQARFIRAHMYLHLVTLWQEVPLITSPTVDVGDVLNVAKSSSAEIYSLIVEDFNFAKANSTESSVSKATPQAATAFLARVALYQQNWSQALSLAEEALGGVDVSTVPYLEDQIYSLAFSPTDGNSLAFFYGPAELGGRHSIEPSPFLINSFEPGDARFPFTVELNFASVPFGLKYPSFAAANAGAATDPIFFIRHAEMALIAAESAAEMGDFGKANTYFNQVRSRAGLDAVTLNGGNFVDAILAERLVEFALEGPFRLIDLRRRGQAELFLAPIGYDACDNIWPLPVREIDRNQNLVQAACCNC